MDREGENLPLPGENYLSPGDLRGYCETASWRSSAVPMIRFCSAAWATG